MDSQPSRRVRIRLEKVHCRNTIRTYVNSLDVKTIGAVQNYEGNENGNGNGNGNVKKAIGLMCKTTILHVHRAFLYISLPSLHDYDVKRQNFKFT